MGIKPPGVKENWDDNSPWVQAKILAYHQRAIYEEVQANTPKKGPPPTPKPRGGRRGGRR